MNANQKSALLMLTLGENRAAEVFKHLNSIEVALISTAMSELNYFSHAQLAEVLEEFRLEADKFILLDVNTNDYLRAVLIKALGEESANSLLDDLLDNQDKGSGIEAFNFLEPQSAADLIREEHPQIIATILVHLKRSQAVEILARFDERTRNDIMLRIATFGGIQPVALQELTEVLNHLLHGQSLKRSKMGGVRPAAEILNLMKANQEESVISMMREFDKELAQKIIDEMFLFENLVDVDDRSIQRILQEIEIDSLVVALKGCDQLLCNKFLKNMSQRQAEVLREDLSLSTPIRMSRVEAEQKNILSVVRRLAESDEIAIGNGEDSYV